MYRRTALEGFARFTRPYQRFCLKNDALLGEGRVTPPRLVVCMGITQVFAV